MDKQTFYSVFNELLCSERGSFKHLKTSVEGEAKCIFCFAQDICEQYPCVFVEGDLLVKYGEYLRIASEADYEYRGGGTLCCVIAVFFFAGV